MSSVESDKAFRSSNLEQLYLCIIYHFMFFGSQDKYTYESRYIHGMRRAYNSQYNKLKMEGSGIIEHR